MKTIPQTFRDHARDGSDFFTLVEILPRGSDTWAAMRYADYACTVDGNAFLGGYIKDVDAIKCSSRIREMGGVATRDPVSIKLLNRNELHRTIQQNNIEGRDVRIYLAMKPLNMVANSSFEAPTSGNNFDSWTETAGHASNSITRQTSGPANGAQYARLINAGSPGPTIQSDPVLVRRGTTVSLSFDAKAASGGQIVRAKVLWNGLYWNNSTRLWQVSATHVNVTLTTSWARYTLDGIYSATEPFTNADAANMSVLFEVNSAGTVDLDAVQLEARPTASAYHRDRGSMAAAEVLPVYWGEVRDPEFDRSVVTLKTKSVMNQRQKRVPIDKITNQWDASWKIPPDNIGKPFPMTYGDLTAEPLTEAVHEYAGTMAAGVLVNAEHDTDNASPAIVAFDSPRTGVVHDSCGRLYHQGENHYFPTLLDDQPTPKYLQDEFDKYESGPPRAEGVLGANGRAEASKTVTAASNASPIVITTSAAHGYSTGSFVRIASVGGNTAANGDWLIDVISSTTFSLRGSTGNGAYTSGGTAVRYISAGYLKSGRFAVSAYLKPRAIFDEGGSLTPFTNVQRMIDLNNASYAYKTFSAANGNLNALVLLQQVNFPANGDVIRICALIDAAITVSLGTLRIDLELNRTDITYDSANVTVLSGAGSAKNIPWAGPTDPETSWPIVKDGTCRRLSFFEASEEEACLNVFVATGGFNATGEVRIYELALRLDFCIALIEAAFCRPTIGRTRNGTSWDGRYSGDDLITSPSEVIEGFLRQELGIATASINTGSFDTAHTARSAWKLAGQQMEFADSIDVLEAMCEAAGCLYYVDGAGKEALSALDHGAPVRALSRRDFIDGSVKLATTPREEVVNDFTLRYSYQPHLDEFRKSFYCNKDGQDIGDAAYATKCAASYAQLGDTVYSEEFSTRWIADDATAKKLMKWLVDWRRKKKRIITARGSVDLLDLEFGDLVDLQLDEYLLERDTDTPRPVFVPIEFVIRRGRVDIEFLEVVSP